MDLFGTLSLRILDHGLLVRADGPVDSPLVACKSLPLSCTWTRACRSQRCGIKSSPPGCVPPAVVSPQDAICVGGYRHQNVTHFPSQICLSWFLRLTRIVAETSSEPGGLSGSCSSRCLTTRRTSPSPPAVYAHSDQIPCRYLVLYHEVPQAPSSHRLLLVFMRTMVDSSVCSFSWS